MTIDLRSQEENSPLPLMSADLSFLEDDFHDISSNLAQLLMVEPHIDVEKVLMFYRFVLAKYVDIDERDEEVIFNTTLRRDIADLIERFGMFLKLHNSEFKRGIIIDNAVYLANYLRNSITMARTCLDRGVVESDDTVMSVREMIRFGLIDKDEWDDMEREIADATNIPLRGEGDVKTGKKRKK